MKNYWKIALMSLLLYGIVSCDKRESYEHYVPPKVVYDEVLSVNLGYISQPEIADPEGVFGVNVVFPNPCFSKLCGPDYKGVMGKFSVETFGEKKLLFYGGSNGIETPAKELYFELGDGVDENADAHYYSSLKIRLQEEGVFDLRIMYHDAINDLCTSKFRVTLHEDEVGFWTVKLQPIEE